MKYVLNLIFCVALLGAFTACNKENNVEQTVITLTPADLDGTWYLKDLNGEPLDEGLYVYITFDRKERTFVMYENIASMYSHKTTGTFSIVQDEELGSIISGEYDYEQGVWNEYVVKEMDGSSLSLCLKDNPEDISVYTRCEEVPAEIINGSRTVR